MKKEMIIILLTYLTTSVIKGIIMAFTTIRFNNIFFDKFELVPFFVFGN